MIWLRLDDNLPSNQLNFADYHRTGATTPQAERARRRFGQRSGLPFGLIANDAVYAALVREAPEQKPWLAVLDGYWKPEGVNLVLAPDYTCGIFRASSFGTRSTNQR